MRIIRTLRTGVAAVTRVMSAVAFATVVFLMVTTVVSVASRWLGHPLLGSDEVIKHAMVVLIAFALAYAQAEQSHISVDLLVNRLPRRAQLTLNRASGLFISGAALLVAWIYVQENVAQDSSASTATGLLNVPTLPFKLALAVGFATWGLTALLQVLDGIAPTAHGGVAEAVADMEEDK